MNKKSMSLLRRVFEWALAVRPSQPLTCATWYADTAYNSFQLAHSDVVTFHNYSDAANLEKEIQEKLSLGGPVVCSEYMARTRNSIFQTHLPIFESHNVGAFNWGLVSGKTNTIYAWETPQSKAPEPKIWFHDIFRKNGTPFDEKEIQFIKEITGRIKTESL